MLYQEVSTDVENNNTAGAPSVHVSTSEGGDSFPFHMRITIEQSSKMLRSEILWVTFLLQFPSEKTVPPLSTRNAFEVLRLDQTTKKNLPVKYPKPINGSFELFNKLVNLCHETGVFFRY